MNLIVKKSRKELNNIYSALPKREKYNTNLETQRILLLQKNFNTKTKKAPTPEASEGVATPPYNTYKTPAMIARKGRILGNTSIFSLNVGGVLFFKALAESLSIK